MTAGSPLQAPGCSRDIVFLSGFLFLAVTLLVLRVDPGPSSVLFPLSTRVCGGPARTSPLRPASREHLSPCLPRPVTPSPPLWSVRSSPGRARWGPGPCGAHRVALAGVLPRAGPTGSRSPGSRPVRGPHMPRCVGFQASHLPASGLLPPSLAVPTSSIGSVPNSAPSGKPAQLPGHVPGPGAGFSFR